MIPFSLHRRIPLVRRPFYQRDIAIVELSRAIAERDAAIAERDAAIAERDILNARPAPAHPETKTYSFQGYNIPIDLMMMTGGGPDTFDQISAAHIFNLQKHIGLEPQFTILELGCGIGRDAIPLTNILSAEHGGNYIGIDIIRPSIDWCVGNIHAKNSNFIFYHMNIDDQLHNPNGKVIAKSSYLPVPDRHVDRVVLQSVFTHLLRDDVEHYLREIKRVMKPDATAYITTVDCH